jgi:hypothetical protein
MVGWPVHETDVGGGKEKGCNLEVTSSSTILRCVLAQNEA